MRELTKKQKMVKVSEWELKYIIQILKSKNSTSKIKETINKIYDDGFNDGMNEGNKEPEAPGRDSLQ